MRLLGIDFGTCYIKGAEVKRNGDVVPLKLGKSIDKPRIPNVGLYEKKEDQPATILVGDIVLKRSAPEQDKIKYKSISPGIQREPDAFFWTECFCL